jgi:hypothetical protein
VRGVRRRARRRRESRDADKTWPALDAGGMYRNPSANVTFSDVGLFSYMNQTEAPLVGTRGHASITSRSASAISMRGPPSCAPSRLRFWNSLTRSAICAR